MAINPDVVSFAAAKTGQQVGSGECFDLADQALRAAGARSAADFGTITPTANYVWGASVTRSQAIAGDIVQFSNYRVTVTTVTVTRTTYPNGGFDEQQQTQTESQSRPHHTAIIESVGLNGQMTVLEQNVGTGSTARQGQRNDLYFVTRSDTPQITRNGNQTTTVTRSYAVQGTVWFYHPQAR